MLSLQKGCLVMRTTMATSTNALRPPPPPHPNIELTVLPRQDTPRYLAPRLPSNAYRRSSSIYIYIYIYILSMRRSSGEDVTRDTFPGVNFLCEEKLGSRGNRTRAGSTVSGAQACSGQTVYEIKPPQRA